MASASWGGVYVGAHNNGCHLMPLPVIFSGHRGQGGPVASGYQAALCETKGKRRANDDGNNTNNEGGYWESIKE